MDEAKELNKTANQNHWWEATPIKYDDLHERSDQWTLGADAATATLLQQISSKMIARTHEVEAALKNACEDVDDLQVALSNVTTAFHFLSNTQFTENRTYQEDERTKDVVDKPSSEVPEATQENLVSSCKEAIAEGLKLVNNSFLKVEISDSESEGGDQQEGLTVYKRISPYEKRKLPHIIGSTAFYADDTLGLFDHSVDEEVDNETSSVGSVEIKDLSRPIVGNSSKIEIDDDSDSDETFPTSNKSRLEDSLSSFQTEQKIASSRDPPSVPDLITENSFLRPANALPLFNGVSSDSDQEGPLFGPPSAISKVPKNNLTNDQYSARKEIDRKDNVTEEVRSHEVNPARRPDLPSAISSASDVRGPKSSLFSSDSDDDLFSSIRRVHQSEVDQNRNEVLPYEVSEVERKKPVGGINIFNTAITRAIESQQSSGTGSTSKKDLHTSESDDVISKISQTSENNQVDSSGQSSTRSALDGRMKIPQAKHSLFSDDDNDENVSAMPSRGISSHNTKDASFMPPYIAPSAQDFKNSGTFLSSDEESLFSTPKQTLISTHLRSTQLPPSLPKSEARLEKNETGKSNSLFSDSDDDLFRPVRQSSTWNVNKNDLHSKGMLFEPPPMPQSPNPSPSPHSKSRKSITSKKTKPLTSIFGSSSSDDDIFTPRKTQATLPGSKPDHSTKVSPHPNRESSVISGTIPGTTEEKSIKVPSVEPQIHVTKGLIIDTTQPQIVNKTKYSSSATVGKSFENDKKIKSLFGTSDEEDDDIFAPKSKIVSSRDDVKVLSVKHGTTNIEDSSDNDLFAGDNFSKIIGTVGASSKDLSDNPVTNSTIPTLQPEDLTSKPAIVAANSDNPISKPTGPTLTSASVSINTGSPNLSDEDLFKSFKPAMINKSTAFSKAEASKPSTTITSTNVKNNITSSVTKSRNILKSDIQNVNTTISNSDNCVTPSNHSTDASKQADNYDSSNTKATVEVSPSFTIEKTEVEHPKNTSDSSDDDLFSNRSKPSQNIRSTQSSSQSNSSNILAKSIKEATNKIPDSIIGKKTSKNLFSSDSDEDIFKNPQVNSSNKMVKKLFSDSDEFDDIFSSDFNQNIKSTAQSSGERISRSTNQLSDKLSSQSSDKSNLQSQNKSLVQPSNHLLSNQLQNKPVQLSDQSQEISSIQSRDISRGTLSKEIRNSANPPSLSKDTEEAPVGKTLKTLEQESKISKTLKSKPSKPLDSTPPKPMKSTPPKPQGLRPLESKSPKPLESKPSKIQESKTFKSLHSTPSKPQGSKPPKPLESAPLKPKESKPTKPLKSTPLKPQGSKNPSHLESEPSKIHNSQSPKQQEVPKVERVSESKIVKRTSSVEVNINPISKRKKDLFDDDDDDLEDLFGSSTVISSADKIMPVVSDATDGASISSVKEISRSESKAISGVQTQPAPSTKKIPIGGVPLFGEKKDIPKSNYNATSPISPTKKPPIGGVSLFGGVMQPHLVTSTQKPLVDGVSLFENDKEIPKSDGISTSQPASPTKKLPIGGVALFGGAELLSKLKSRRKSSSSESEEDPKFDDGKNADFSPSNEIKQKEVSLIKPNDGNNVKNLVRNDNTPLRFPQPSSPTTDAPPRVANAPSQEMGVSFDQEKRASEILVSVNKNRPKIQHQRQPPSRLKKSLSTDSDRVDSGFGTTVADFDDFLVEKLSNEITSEIVNAQLSTSEVNSFTVKVTEKDRDSLSTCSNSKLSSVSASIADKSEVSANQSSGRNVDISSNNVHNKNIKTISSTTKSTSTVDSNVRLQQKVDTISVDDIFGEENKTSTLEKIGNIQKPTTKTLLSTPSLFDDDDDEDLFNASKYNVPKNVVSTKKELKKVDDKADDLFKTSKKVVSTKIVGKIENKSTKRTTLFSDDEEDDNGSRLFSSTKTTTTKVLKTSKVSTGRQVVARSSLFEDDDSDNDLFSSSSSKITPKSKEVVNPHKMIAEDSRKPPNSTSSETSKDQKFIDPLMGKIS